MKPDRWRKVDELFEAALEREPHARAAFLEKACGDDADLRREVEKMLSFDRQAEDFIQTDVFDVAARLISQPPKESSLKKSTSTSDSIDDARFIPGDVLSDRYRIAGLLGRGGMGEVYRADDLKLKQAVALKFLPASLIADGAALARFYKEVSVARQISHRHVCRVYDVAEYQGEHFISMEFVRGEELSSLLKRIGRLPQDKAIEVARQLCGGLAAVHERGVLHRDLKPANIMLDEHGEVRITDFGIAALTGELDRREISGTPAYMSPEQLEGDELTAKSDIYSLGLVLYELFTGKKAFEAASLPELLRLRRSDTTPTSLSHIVPELDPLIERVIFRCLERDPAKRPASALQVAAALPGGDPLAAALAAGETPSPEMVAAAPKQGGLKPAIAISLLGSVLVLIAITAFLSRGTALYRMVPLNKSPEVLRDRSTELLKKFGHTESPGDSAFGMGIDRRYLNFVHDTDTSATRWDKLYTAQPPAIYFWYRQSPRPFDVSTGGDVTEFTPARDVPGMTTITVDTLGRLRSLYAVPPQKSSTADSNAPDWSALFAESGLDQSQFQPVTSTWTPPHHTTVRAAWDGSYPDQPDVKIHVEAGAFDGKPVYFEILEAWDEPQQQAIFGRFRQRALIVLLLSVFITVMLGSALLALRNLKLGRGDRKGAFRLAAFVLAIFFLSWLFSSHHVSTEDEALNFISSAQNMLFWTFFFWVVYIAFEPFVRRRWPGRIISWSRLLAGGFRDPLVGRDILIGALFGLGMILSNFYLANLVPQWLGYPPSIPWWDFPATQLLGLRSFAHGITNQIFASIFQSFILLFFLLLLYILLRRERVAAFALWVIMAITLSLTHDTPAGVPFSCLGALLVIWVLYRYGLLALISSIFFLHLIIFYPVTSDLSAWYAADFVLALIICLALVVFGFYTSLAGEPLFRGALPDD